MFLDRGCGIAPEDLPNIFQMFYTSRARWPDASPGMGLGLAICEAIVQAHGGSIAASNREDGPRRAVLLHTSQRRATGETGGITMNFSATILVIEDDQQIRRYIGYALKEESFRVLDAPTAQRGLSVLVSEIVDLVLLDLGLPDYDGMDVIRKIREWSQVPIIVVSARDQAPRGKRTRSTRGADDYLTKPFSTTELMARIRVALRHLYRETKSKGTNILRTGDLKIDLEKRLVYLREEELHTTPMEYALLSTLFRNAGKVLTSNYIIREVWGNNYGSDTQALRGVNGGAAP